jgi:hypothetical protein
MEVSRHDAGSSALKSSGNNPLMDLNMRVKRKISLSAKKKEID